MKCPKCGQELRPSKKEPEFMLCYDCKKKYRVKKQQEADEEQKYSNIPPKHVREKREKQMREAYDEMLAVGDGKKKKKQPKKTVKPTEEYYDDYDDGYDDYDEKSSKAPFIILGIAIVAVAAVIVYMYFFR